MDNKQFSILLTGVMFLAFLGAFLGTLVCFKEMNPTDFNKRPFPHFMQEQMVPPPMHGEFIRPNKAAEKMIEEQDELLDKAEDNFEDMMEHVPTPARLVLVSSGGIKTEEMGKAFKVIVDLKPFNNDEKNIKVSTHGDKIFVVARYKSDKNGEFNSAQLHQMLTFPVKVDASKIKKQKEGNSLVIIVPKK